MTPSHSGMSRGALLFWVSQAAIMATFAVLPWARATSLDVPPPLPTVQNQPLTVTPRYNEPSVITDQQLALVLEKLRPRLRKPRPKISVLDHALRCWGADVSFADESCLSGPEMRSVLLNHQSYASLWGEDARPLLYREAHGIAVRTQEGSATASHVDHTLATLAEVGTPLDYPVLTNTGPGSVRNIFAQALREFSLNQQEYEWTALVLALYAPTPAPWTTKEGQRITFDLLAERIMRQSYDEGVCYGNHRLYTLAVLLQVDESHSILTPDTAAAVRDHLLEATSRLTQTQHAEGWWDSNWAHGAPVPAGQKWGDVSRRLLATGHALEWWAIAPPSVQPPREVVIRASQWLVREVEKLDETSVDDNYTFLSHIGRALALWRGDVPANLYTSTAHSQPSKE